MNVVATSPPDDAESLGWMLFSDETYGPRLAAQLEAMGDHCILIGSGERFERVGHGRYRIRPGSDDDYRALLSSIRNNGYVPCRRVVELRGLDEREGSLRGQVLESSLRLVEALGGEGPKTYREQFWLLTRGAVAPRRPGAAPSPGQSALWGLGRAIQGSCEGLETRLIDLDPGRLTDQSLAQLALELRDGDDEDALAIRDGQRLAPRLSRLTGRGGKVRPPGVTTGSISWRGTSARRACRWPARSRPGGSARWRSCRITATRGSPAGPARTSSTTWGPP